MQKGKLIKWDDEKGFGFIEPQNSAEQVFFHISTLQGTTRRPVVGDTLLFNVVSDEKGRRKAADVSIEGVKSVFAERSLGKNNPYDRQNKPLRTEAGRSRQFKPRRGSGRAGFGFGVVVMVIAVLFGVDQIQKRRFFVDLSTPSSEVDEFDTLAVESSFKCEGKTRCTQMTSCEEAMFYLNNCPGSVTDGDGDGRPCEDQWCGH
ncbi:cold shock domain-containing protein [Methylomonas sp. MgM2]